MKFVAVLALATAAAASPAKREACTFGTYACTADNTGIQICNIQGQWELVGPCPSGTSCEDLPQNGFDLPFCTNNPAKRSLPVGYCFNPGQYECDGPTAIKVCNVTHGYEKVGDCPKKSHCDYIGAIPYCVN